MLKKGYDFLLVTLLAGHSFEKNFILKAVIILTLNTHRIPIAIDCIQK